jgi:gliding motility-associated-like protein
VTVSYTNGCSSSDNVAVTVNSIPSVSVSAVPNPFAYHGQIVTFTATPTGYNNYNFYVNNVLVQSGSSNIYESCTLENGQVLSVVANETGCDSELDSVVMDIKPIPNAFTPYDVDGKNDIFVKGLDLKIINRWGEKLYEGVDGWDGKYNGTLVSPGTYYYVIKLSDLKNVITELTGTVTVVSSKQ